MPVPVPVSYARRRKLLLEEKRTRGADMARAAAMVVALAAVPRAGGRAAELHLRAS